MIDLVEDFIRAKMNMISQKINEMFKIVSFKLFDVQIKDNYDFRDNVWINEIDGMEVRVITPILGRVKFYAIAPTWCREVE